MANDEPKYHPAPGAPGWSNSPPGDVIPQTPQRDATAEATTTPPPATPVAPTKPAKPVTAPKPKRARMRAKTAAKKKKRR